MPELMPVPGQLEITAEEFELLVSAGFGDKDRVRKQIAAVNNLRLGTPPGEIRRSERGSVAHRTQDADGNLHWEVLHQAAGCGPHVTEADVENWRTIHPATWLDRVHAGDFEQEDKK